MPAFPLKTLVAPALLALVSAFVAPGPPAPAVPIPWSAGRPLTVEDFQGRPAPGERLAALTSATIDAKAACRDFVFAGEARAVFDPATSWIRDPKTLTPALLRHEQLHFDLTEVHARRLRQKLQGYGAKVDCTKLQPGFDNLTRGVYAEWERDENRYDQETNHGLNTARQGYWERQTQLRLEQLKAFAL